MFYLELVTDLLHLCVYVVFFFIVFTNYGLPLHLVRARAARLHFMPCTGWWCCHDSMGTGRSPMTPQMPCISTQALGILQPSTILVYGLVDHVGQAMP